MINRDKKSGIVGIIITVIILIVLVAVTNNSVFIEGFANKIVMPINYS